MTDLDKMARELLAAEFPPSDPRRSALIHGGTALDLQYGLSLRAIAAALREAPAGFVMVPAEPTDEMVSAAEEAYMPFGDMGLAIQMAIAASPKAGSEGA